MTQRCWLDDSCEVSELVIGGEQEGISCRNGRANLAAAPISKVHGATARRSRHRRKDSSPVQQRASKKLACLVDCLNQRLARALKPSKQEIQRGGGRRSRPGATINLN